MKRSILTFALAASLGACSTAPQPSSTGVASAADDPRFAGVVTRRLFSAPLYEHPALGRSGSRTITRGNASPDGRKMLVSVPSQGPAGGSDLAVFDLSTGQITRLETRPEGWSGAVFSSPGIFSRDGNQIAFGRTGSPTFVGLAIAASDGSGARRLMPPSETHRARIVQDWSPDGRTILLVGYGRDFRQQLLLVSVADGSSRVLKSLDWREPITGRFSPDGRWIAYAVNPGEGAGEHEVFVLAVDGSRETQLSHSGLAKEVLGWSSAGDALFYWEWSKEGFASVWRIPMSGATASGPAQRVRGDIVDAQPIQMVGDRILYHTSVGSTPGQLFEVELDPATGSARGVPRPASPNRQGSVHSTAISPDGARIAYQVAGSGSPVLVIRSTATGAEREMVPALESVHRITRWAEDGESLLLEGQRQGVYGLYRYDPRSGQLSLRTATPVPTSQPTPQRYVATNSEGSIVYFVADGFSTLVAHDLESGAERVLLAKRAALTIGATLGTLSPDGKHLAFLEVDNATQYFRYGRVHEVRIVPTDGGPARTIFKGSPDEQVERNSDGGTRPAWAPDGKYLYVATSSSDPQGRVANSSPLGPRRIWRVPVDGGEPREVLKLENTVLPLGGLSVSPDGRRLFFSGGGGSPDATGEIWVMENLSPAPVSTATRGR